MMMIEEEYIFEDTLVNDILTSEQKLVLVTAHRRENLGKPMENIFRAIKRLADNHTDITVVYPIHLNPKVRAIANSILNNHERIHLIEPMIYKPFVNLCAKAHLMLTDSGGIQEESPALNIPVLVLRTETERPEGVDAGTLLMAGVEEDAIYDLAHDLLTNEASYKKVANAENPYGNGTASTQIISAIKAYFAV
jgi:UDP-N-acetylglucosamine 2-epimerase (non-hydrolysing)